MVLEYIQCLFFVYRLRIRVAGEGGFTAVRGVSVIAGGIRGER